MDAFERAKRMRILVIAGNYPPNITGGGEIATQILAEGFADAGAVVKALTCGKERRLRHDGNVAVQEVESPNIYWRFSSNKNVLKKAAWHALDNYNPRSFRRVRAAILEYRPDLVVTSILENFGAAAWMAARSVGTPVVDIVHSYYLECLWGGRFRNGANCIGRCMRCRAATSGRKYFSSFVNGVVGVSRYVLDQHLSEGFFSRAASTYIYNPVLARA
jgi:glycosyltransferase involved in cell wall biosynthesis